MYYSIAFGLSALETALLIFYFRKLRLFNGCSENDDTIVSVNKLQPKTQFCIAIAVIASALFGCSFLLVNNISNIPNLIKLLLLMGVLGAAAAVDLKKTIIPNLLIFIGLGARVIIYLAELVFYNKIFVPQLISDAIGFGIGFGILLIAAFVAKGALGFGDVKLFGVIGLMSGAICTYTTLIFSLVLTTVVSVILIIAKKKNRKDSIPFGPFIFFGYIIAIIQSCY